MERHNRSDSFGRSDALASSAGEPGAAEHGQVVGEAHEQPLPWPEPKDTDGSRWLQRLRDLHRHLPPELMGGDAAAEIRAMRDERDF